VAKRHNLGLHGGLIALPIIKVGEKTPSGNPMPGELEGKLYEKLGKEMEAKIAAKIKSFGGLLTRSAAVRLLCKEHGVDTESPRKLGELSGSLLPFSFAARVDRIFPVQEYQNGAGRSVRLHLSDSSGCATLVLWNEQASLVEGSISIGDIVLGRGAYLRGGEIMISKSGSLSRLKAAPVVPIGKLSAGACNVEGEVSELELDYAYVDRKSGEKRTLSSFILCQGKDCRRVLVWSAPEGTAMPMKGDRLLLENVVFKNGELHFNFQSRMVIMGGSRQRKARLDSVAVGEDFAVFSLGGEAFPVPLDDALSLLGIKSVPAGVAPRTLAAIKGKSLCGSQVSFRLEGGKLAWLSLREKEK